MGYALRLLLARRARRRRGASSGASPPPGAGGRGKLMDTLRWGAFLGSFAGTYVAADEAIALLGGAERRVLARPALFATLQR